MRAFMSTDESPARQSFEQDQLDGRPLGLEVKAEHEARAILAENEPEIMSAEYATPYTQSDMRLTVTTRDYEGYAVAVACLADALRAFVGEE